MAEPLKYMYNEQFLNTLSNKILLVYDEFDYKGFISETLSNEYESLELKQRMRRITTTLAKFLPSNYPDALNILLEIKHDCYGFEYMIFPDFVEVFGLNEEHYDISINALINFTEHASSEFAIRQFIVLYQEQTMKHMLNMTKHENEHIRRLATEGCRPRLPWAIALPEFKKDPSKVLEILEVLKNDESLYVRKSVANNLNDISKDNPDLVIDIAKKWLLTNKPLTDWIVRKGCRTLIKENNPSIMELYGYKNDIDILDQSISISKADITTKDVTTIEYSFLLNNQAEAKIRLEYGIYYIKNNGKGSLKKFLIFDKNITSEHVKGSKKHDWQERSTRKHYSGNHRIVLVINGKEIAETSTNLLV